MTARSELLDYSEPSDILTKCQPKIGKRGKAIEKTGKSCLLVSFKPKKKALHFLNSNPPTNPRNANPRNPPPTSKQNPHHLFRIVLPLEPHPHNSPVTTMPQNPRTLSTTPVMHSHTASTSGPIWAELASLTLQAFTPELIKRLQSFISRTPSFDATTHIPLLATLVIRHITLSLKESSLPATRSFRDVAYHAVMSNKILTKRERSIVRAVSVGRVAPKPEKIVDQIPMETPERKPAKHVFPRAGGKDCLQSASMRRLLIANQSPLDVDLLEKTVNMEQRKEHDHTGRKRERKRQSTRYPGRTVEVREVKSHPRRTYEDTSTANERDTGENRVLTDKENTLREPRVRRERPSRLVQLRKQRLERRKASVI